MLLFCRQNCSVAEERAKADNRYLIIKDAELIQLIYFKIALTSKCKNKENVTWEMNFFCLCFHTQYNSLGSILANMD